MNDVLLLQLKASRASMIASIAFLDAVIEGLEPKVLEPVGRCPHCGSPKRVDVSGMGAKEWKCLDCETVYPEESPQ